MSKFDWVLSDDEMASIANNKDLHTTEQKYRHVEQAVLAKLAEQGPVAYAAFAGNGNIRIWTASKTEAGDISEQIGVKVQPLYTHPMPNCQGFLDSSKTITKENLPPLPEPHCKHGGGIGYFDSYSKEQMIEYAKSAIDRHKAMLTAPQSTSSAQICRNLIRALALKNGFTLKGEDLHEYVYNFANELASVVADSALFDKSTKNHAVGNNEMVSPLAQRKIQSVIDNGEYREMKGATVLVSEEGRAFIASKGGAFYWVDNEALAREYDGTLIDEGTKEHHRSTKNHIPDVSKMVGSDHIADMRKKVPEGWQLIPKEPDQALLVSMATCLNHGFGLLTKEKQDGQLYDMRKLYDEVVGKGYYSPKTRERYLAMLAAAPKYTGEK